MTNAESYERKIPRRERELFERALGMEGGYVLHLSDRQFDDVIFEAIGVDPAERPDLFHLRHSLSKANRLRSFIGSAPPNETATVLRSFWEVRLERATQETVDFEAQLKENYFGIIARLEGQSKVIDSSEILVFQRSQTLEELVASIKREIDSDSPHAAMERLHTFCMKRFAHLVFKHSGRNFEKEEPLHSRVAVYINILKENHNLHLISERIIKSSISIFESLNFVRNDNSFAHDSMDLVSREEARFIFESISNILRYFKSLDVKGFEDP